MKRRILTLALLLTVLYPLAAGATGPAADPDGVTTAFTGGADWLEATIDFLRSWFRM